jgi:hypothetical protein
MAGNCNPDLSSDDLDSANASESSVNSTNIRCRLLELPVEIRLIIYGFVFGDRTLHIGWEKGAKDPLKERLGVDLFRLQCGLAENHTPGEWLETRDAGRPLQQQKPFQDQR